jgi:hypothetical protein
MCFAEPDSTMNVERIEHHDVTVPCHCNLAGGGMGKRIAAADDESIKSQARVERRAPERLVQAGAEAG